MAERKKKNLTGFLDPDFKQMPRLNMHMQVQPHLGHMYVSLCVCGPPRTLPNIDEIINISDKYKIMKTNT